jgi:polysaccharide biosynthesis/export protein
MIRLHISAILLGAALLAGCVDRPPLSEPASVGSGPYLLGSGDELRIVVYDQPSLTNLYEVDQSGQISMPLIGDVAAQDSTADELANRIEARLATAYLRDPNVTVEVANYRPFFVLGEVGDPGQFPYVPGITAETAIAVAGSFTDRANRRVVRVSRTVHGQLFEERMPVTERIRPGDTIYVFESLF